jgi:hypothetical protein
MVVTVYKKTFRGFSIRCHFEKGAWWATAHTRNEKGLARRSYAKPCPSKEEAFFRAEYLVLKRECKLSESPQALILDSNIIYRNKPARRLMSDSEVEVGKELIQTSFLPIEIINFATPDPTKLSPTQFCFC